MHGYRPSNVYAFVSCLSSFADHLVGTTPPHDAPALGNPPRLEKRRPTFLSPWDRQDRQCVLHIMHVPAKCPVAKKKKGAEGVCWVADVLLHSAEK